MTETTVLKQTTPRNKEEPLGSYPIDQKPVGRVTQTGQQGELVWRG